MTTYAKLRDGSWGIRWEGTSLKAGAKVLVERRDGSRQIHTVGRVVFRGNGICLATIARDDGHDDDDDDDEDDCPVCGDTIMGQDYGGLCWQCAHSEY